MSLEAASVVGLDELPSPCYASGKARMSTARALDIAMIAPPWFAVPPKGYGGVENVCADLVDGLVERGHRVTLIGAGESGTGARFVATYKVPPSSRLGEPLPEMVHAAAAARFLADHAFDVVHDHTLAGPLLARGRHTPTVVTVHGPVQGEPGLYYRSLGDTIHPVAVSSAQRRSAPDLVWAGTVPNAVDVATFPFRAAKENLLLFLGRMHPGKGAHLAIDAARAVGMPIVLAGKCAEPVEREYFDSHIKSRLGPDVTVFGVADAVAKRDLLSRAAALIFPILWDEPFGMVMIEAMACGTPVVALRRGSVPEVVVSGVTGAICDEPEGLADAIRAALRLDPRACRAHVESHFHVDGMVSGYEAVYRHVIGVHDRGIVPAGGLAALVAPLPTTRTSVLMAP